MSFEINPFFKTFFCVELKANSIPCVFCKLPLCVV